jgi:hypothetical protein
MFFCFSFCSIQIPHLISGTENTKNLHFYFGWRVFFPIYSFAQDKKQSAGGLDKE